MQTRLVYSFDETKLARLQESRDSLRATYEAARDHLEHWRKEHGRAQAYMRQIAVDDGYRGHDQSGPQRQLELAEQELAAARDRYERSREAWERLHRVVERCEESAARWRGGHRAKGTLSVGGEHTLTGA